MPVFTILGASGFIGSHLIEHLRAAGAECQVPGRDDWTWLGRDAGHVVYCIGLSADFRSRPWDTMRAHVCRLIDVLDRGCFESLLYLSSTRIYAGSSDTREIATLQASPLVADDLYNLSKLAGEAACFAHPSPRVRVARLSNVFGRDPGSENFLTTVVREALGGAIVLRTSGLSEKDYVSVQDVGRYLTSIAEGGRERVYNVASGVNVTNGAIAESLARLTGCAVHVVPGAQTVRFAPIDVSRIQDEFGAARDDLVRSLPRLIGQHPTGEQSP